MTIGGPGGVLGADQITAFVRDQLATAPVDGRSVCVLVPDGTRTCPLPLLLAAVHGALAGRVSALTVLIALGTHRGDERSRARRAPRLSGRRSSRPLSRDAGAQPPVAGPGGANHDRYDQCGEDWPRSARVCCGPKCRCGSTARCSSTMSRWSEGRSSRTRSSSFPVATSTSSLVCPARK